MNVQQENEAAADVLRDANALAPAGSLGPVQHAHVPPAHLLGGLSVRCARCGVVLRPGQPRAVQIEPSGAVRCVVCPSKKESRR